MVFEKKVTKTEEEFIKQHKDRLSKYDSDKKMKFRYKRGNPLIRIETPIVLVCGLLESTGKLKFLLNLKKIVEKEGYKISAIGTRDYCEMLDMYSFPKFMTNKIREVDKIVAFNNYVRHIEYIDKPDLILIGIPGGVNTYSQEIFSDFGMMACEVLRAVKPDCSVLCTPCYLADLLEVEMSIKEIEGRLGINIDYILMDNKIICANESERYKEIRFLTVDEKEVLTQLKQYNKTNYFSAVSESNKVAKYVLEQLGKYGTVQTI